MSDVAEFVCVASCTALHRHQELRVSIDPVRMRKLIDALCTLQDVLGLKPTSVKEKRCLHCAQCFHIGSGASDPPHAKHCAYKTALNCRCAPSQGLRSQPTSWATTSELQVRHTLWRRSSHLPRRNDGQIPELEAPSGAVQFCRLVSIVCTIWWSSAGTHKVRRVRILRLTLTLLRVGVSYAAHNEASRKRLREVRCRNGKGR